MKILTDKELEFVGSLNKIQQVKLARAFHEAGHAIACLGYRIKFHQFYVAEIGHAGNEGGAVRFEMPDGHTHKEFITIALAGWAADEVFLNLPRDFYDSRLGYGDDLSQIKAIVGDKLPLVLEGAMPAVKSLIEANVEILKVLAFALYHKGELTFDECKQLLVK